MSVRGRRPDLLFALLADERGGKVLEWAMVAALLLVATFAAVGSVAGKGLAKWDAADAGL